MELELVGILGRRRKLLPARCHTRAAASSWSVPACRALGRAGARARRVVGDPATPTPPGRGGRRLPAVRATASAAPSSASTWGRSSVVGGSASARSRYRTVGCAARASRAAARSCSTTHWSPRRGRAAGEPRLARRRHPRRTAAAPRRGGGSRARTAGCPVRSRAGRADGRTEVARGRARCRRPRARRPRPWPHRSRVAASDAARRSGTSSPRIATARANAAAARPSRPTRTRSERVTASGARRTGAARERGAVEVCSSASATQQLVQIERVATRHVDHRPRRATGPSARRAPRG